MDQKVERRRSNRIQSSLKNTADITLNGLLVSLKNLGGQMLSERLYGKYPEKKRKDLTSQEKEEKEKVMEKHNLVKASVKVLAACALGGTGALLQPVSGVCYFGAVTNAIFGLYHIRSNLWNAPKGFKFGVLFVLTTGFGALVYYLNTKKEE